MIKLKFVVAGFSALSFGTAASSIIILCSDSIATIGYQVAMIYSVFSLYELDTREYKIKDIILSGGNTIEFKDEYKQKNEKENYFDDNKEKWYSFNYRKDY